MVDEYDQQYRKKKDLFCELSMWAIIEKNQKSKKRKDI
jgi:hypothetical protein